MRVWKNFWKPTGESISKAGERSFGNLKPEESTHEPSGPGSSSGAGRPCGELPAPEPYGFSLGEVMHSYDVVKVLNQAQRFCVPADGTGHRGPSGTSLLFHALS